MRRGWGGVLGGCAAAALVTSTIWWWDLEGLVPIVQAVYPLVSAAALGLLVLAAVTRARRSFAVSLLAFLVTLAAMAPTVLPTDGSRPSAASAQGTAGTAGTAGVSGSSPVSLSVLALNTQFGEADVDILAKEVVDRRVDVLVLTEAHPGFTPYVTDDRWKALLPYDSGRTLEDARGTLILSRYPMTVVNRDTDTAGHQQPIVTLDVHGTKVTMRGVHPRSPSSDEKLPQWHADLVALAAWSHGTPGPLVVAGDFNAAWPHPAFRALADGFADAMRVTGQAWAPTWPQEAQVPPFTQIDHVLSRGFSTQAADRVHVPGTDHLGVWAQLSLG